MKVEHWMVFGTFAQQDYFEYPQKGTYDGVILNANMVAHAPAGLAAFLQEKRAGGKYLIDPLTHAFQHDPSVISDKEGEPKAAIRKMADLYGPPIADLAGKRPIKPADLKTSLENVVEKCAENQTEFLQAYMRQTDAAKYLEDECEMPPYAFVAPYFYLTETTLDQWMPVNVRSLKIARKVVDGMPRTKKLFAAVVVSQGIVIDREAREKLIRGYEEADIDGIVIWIDNLDEIAAGGAELRGFMRLAAGLRAGGKREVINLHGGYFSVLAGGIAGNGAFSGVAHGPEFGEYRGVVPVGGGIPIARYYVPKLHARVKYRDAARMFQMMGWLKSAKAFHENVCDCEVCKSTLDGDAANFALFGEGTTKNVRRRHGIVRIDFPTRDTTQRCLKHYLQWKRREYISASKAASRDLLLSELEEGAVGFEEAAGLDGVAHLRMWARVLNKVHEAE